MAVTVRELKEWLATLDENDLVGVDEGGLCLRVNEEHSESYYEIGGMPEPEDTP